MAQSSERKTLLTGSQVRKCRTIITRKVEQRSLKALKDIALKERALMDRTLGHWVLNDFTIKDRAMRDNTASEHKNNSMALEKVFCAVFKRIGYGTRLWHKCSIDRFLSEVF